MFYRKILILLILIKFRVECKEGEDRTSVKFLLSDAKDPEFNLGEFRQKKIIEDDNVPAESIILPTLNLESHPYAVVVLPDLNKFAAKTFKKGRLTLEDIISGSIGINRRKEEEEKEQNPSSSYETTETEIDGISLPAIPVLSVVKSDGEIIDLNQSLNPEISTVPEGRSDGEFDLNQDLNSEISAIPDEEFEGEKIDASENLNQTSTDENSLNYDYEFINTEPPIEDIEIDTSKRPVDVEKPNMIPANSITTIKNIKNNLEKFLPSRSAPDQDTSGEVLSAEKTDNLRKTSSSNDRYKISAASLEKKSRVTFKGFPLKFSSIISTSKGSKDIKSLESVEGALVSKIYIPPKNKTLLPTTIIKAQSIQTLPIVNEFSSFRNSQSPDELDPQDPNSATKNQFLTLGKARELRPIPVKENNFQEISNNKKDVILEAPSENDDIEHSKQNKKSIGSDPIDYVKLLSEALAYSNKTEAKNLSEKKAFNSNLYLGSDTLSNAFEFVRSIGIPLSTTEKSKEETNHSLPQKEKSSSSEQRDQISQLIKLRKQLMLLDTSSFATENVGRSNDEVNPENVIGSYLVDGSKSVEFDTKPLISNISGEIFANKTVDSPRYSNEPQIIYSKPILGKENKDSTLTWGKFLKKNSAENENYKPSYSTPPPSLPPPPSKENVKFNHLESIKAPIKENFNLHTRNKTNQNEENSVIFEKFDITNAISSASSSKYSFTSNNENNNENNNNNHNNNNNNNFNNFNEQVSYNLPELSIDDLSSYESHEQNREILQRGSESFTNLHKRPIVKEPTILSSQEPTILSSQEPTNLSSQEPTVLSNQEPTAFISQEQPALPSPSNYFTNTLQSSLPDYYINEGCNKNKENCIDTTTRKSEIIKFYTSTPTIVDFPSQLLVPSFESIPASTSSIYTHNQVEPRSISSFTDFTVMNPVHRASIAPTDIASTPYLIHNVLSLKTITQYATVTVMTPSIVIHTHTEVIEQTRYVTISKTIAAEPLYTSTILHVMPDPKTVTISVAASTVTSTINFAPTVTHTLYSTICSHSVEDLSEAREPNNYGIDTETLMGVPSNFHLRSSEFKKSLNSDGDEFDEVYWPKTDSKRDAWPEGFDAEKFEPSSEYIGTYDNHLPDSEAQESGSIMSVVKPDRTYMRRNRQRMSRSNEFEDSSLIYGVPFYGLRPIDNDFPMYKSPGNGNSIKNKV